MDHNIVLGGLLIPRFPKLSREFGLNIVRIHTVRLGSAYKVKQIQVQFDENSVDNFRHGKTNPQKKNDCTAAKSTDGRHCVEHLEHMKEF